MVTWQLKNKPNYHPQLRRVQWGCKWLFVTAFQCLLIILNQFIICFSHKILSSAFTWKTEQNTILCVVILSKFSGLFFNQGDCPTAAAFLTSKVWLLSIHSVGFTLINNFYSQMVSSIVWLVNCMPPWSSVLLHDKVPLQTLVQPAKFLACRSYA